jgi:hypothetical protein
MVGRFNLKGQTRYDAQKAVPVTKATRSLPAGKPKIALNDREFGKY